MVTGQQLSFQGAYVQASGSWRLTVEAVDQNGSVLDTAVLTGQGSQTGLSYVLGPINEPGAQVSLRGTLQEYTDASYATPVGSPVTQTSGVVAVVAATTGAPALAPVVSATLSGSVATVTFSAVGGANSYEVAQADANGSPIGIYANGVTMANGTGTAAFDPQGNVGFFTTQSSAWNIPAGETVRFIVRGCDGSGPQALCGPWSSPAVVSTPTGTPVFTISNVRFDSSTNGLKFTVTNTGTTYGSPGAYSAALEYNGYVVAEGAVGLAEDGVGSGGLPVLQVGQSINLEIGMYFGWITPPAGAAMTAYITQGPGYYFGGYYTDAGLVQTGDQYQPGRPWPGPVSPTDQPYPVTYSQSLLSRLLPLHAATVRPRGRGRFQNVG
jgi:hypothetical protein